MITLYTLRHIIAVLQGNEKKEKDEENTADTKGGHFIILIYLVYVLCALASSDIKVSMLLPGPAVEKVTCFWKENRVGGVHDKVRLLRFTSSHYIAGVCFVTLATRG